jgi:hypothetical protein
MTREPLPPAITLLFRTSDRALIFNKLVQLDSSIAPTVVASRSRFAQTASVPSIKQGAAMAAHRPASRPGAD